MKEDDTPNGGELSWKERDRSLKKVLHQTTQQDETGQHPKQYTKPGQNHAISKRVFIQPLPQEYEVVDLSSKGVSFLSSSYFAKGSKLVLSAMNLIALEVEVLDCVMEVDKADDLQYHYHVHGCFGPNVSGDQVKALAYEMRMRAQNAPVL